MRLPSVLTGQTTSGSRTIEPSVIFQLVANSTASRKNSVKMCRKPQGQILRKRVPHALDVVDDRGHQASGLMVLKEADGLPDDFRIDLIPQIGDARNSRVLHQHVAKKFRDALADKNSQDGNREQSSDAVNPGGKKGVQINRLVGEADS